MKKISIILSVLMLGLGLASCESQLDIPQKSVLDLATYYETAGPDEAEALTARLHKQFFSGVAGIHTMCFLEIISDDCYAGGGGGSDNSWNMRDAGNYITTSSDYCPRTQYTGVYRLIYYANCIIERIPESSDPVIVRAKAEAKFFRAVAMFEALRWWGTPPLADHLYADDEYNAPNGDPKEIITFCLNNFDEAAAALKPKSQMPAKTTYVTKEAALAYKGKAALWYGQKYNDNEVLAQAAPALKQVMDSGQYELESDITVLGRKAGDFSKEYILEHNSADNDGFVDGNQMDLRHTYLGLRNENMILPKLFHGGWGWCGVSKEFAEFLIEHEGGIEANRFKSTIITLDQLLAMEYDATVADSLKRVEKTYPDNQGYFRVKNSFFEGEQFPSNAFWKYSSANWYYMRYAEVLLLYAEACQLTGSDTAGGLAALNKVRQRAGLAPASALTYDLIKDERRAELFGEAERYFDIVRWGEAASKLANKGKKVYQLRAPGYKQGVPKGGPDSWDIVESDGPGAGWSEKWLLLPFPYAQIQANPNLKQNDGW